MKKEKIVDYVQYLIASSLITFAVVSVYRFVVYHKFQTAFSLQYVAATVAAVVYIALVKEVKFISPTETKKPNQIYYPISIILATVIASLVVWGYLLPAEWVTENNTLLFAMIASFILGLNRIRYSLVFNLVFVLFLFYAGVESLSQMFALLGYGALVTLSALACKFIFGKKWSNILFKEDAKVVPIRQD